MQNASPQQQALIARRRQFIHSLAQAHFQRGQPLPQQFTSINTPGYDPATSPWNRLPLSTEPGKLRVNGRDIDVFQIFHIFMQRGGAHKVASLSSPAISRLKSVHM